MAQSVECGLRPGRFILRQQHSAISTEYGGHGLVAALLQGGHGTLLGGQSVGVTLGAVKTFDRGNGVGRNADGHQRGLLLEFEVVRQGALVRRHGHTRHHLHATPHSQAVVVHGLLSSQMNSAQARGAVAVDAQAGHLVAPAGSHQGEFADVGTLIGRLRDAAEDGVTHLCRIDAGLLGQCLELLGQ